MISMMVIAIQEYDTVIYMVIRYLLIVLGLLISISIITQQQQNSPTAKQQNCLTAIEKERTQSDNTQK